MDVISYKQTEENTAATKTESVTTNNFNLPDGYGHLLRYTTFIPMEYAPNPWCDLICTTYEYFGGDNRGFDAWPHSFRTRSDAYVIWDWDGSENGVVHNPLLLITT
ncbi:hypothetical protein HXA34_03695 [Salipaludibacillus agaradhaerens]|uniref:hypothetical protein n=1 Tax=Salipaludibacillus agaradhaerens TaxID=76935 RepID=UPI002150DF2C|nr:hypothetical protein [Salipaludibacillus agaradhaerens]MCR6105382.1 hypothetical protein [Salipaludibacillus agaradhaerens]MCR6117423.1 hypothetical protein [Salipaludibacillus agaradhaerens]